MRKLCLVFLSILICTSVFAQKDNLYLYKLPDKNHKIKIKPGAWIEIHQKSFTPDSIRIDRSISGELNFALNDSINMMVKEINTSTMLDSVLRKQITITGKKWPKEAYKSESYALDNIRLIRYQNRTAHVFTKIGTNLLIASLLTATIVAPLASINYNDGTFNMDTYKSVLIAGGIGFVVSIPILIFSQKKYIHLEKGKFKPKKKRYTHIKPM
mgnify:CR=1 FL=1